jgi:hypothetical protein
VNTNTARTWASSAASATPAQSDPGTLAKAGKAQIKTDAPASSATRPTAHQPAGAGGQTPGKPGRRPRRTDGFSPFSEALSGGLFFGIGIAEMAGIELGHSAAPRDFSGKHPSAALCLGIKS